MRVTAEMLKAAGWRCGASNWWVNPAVRGWALHTFQEAAEIYKQQMKENGQ